MRMCREAFLERLRQGFSIELNVATRFLMEGLPVKMDPYQEDRSDEYDIKVYSRNRWREIEVKGRNLEFTSPEDFPYDSAFVETKSRWESRPSRPAFFVFVSQKTGEMVALKPDPSTFTYVKRKDTQKGYWDVFIETPKEELISFEDMLEIL